VPPVRISFQLIEIIIKSEWLAINWGKMLINFAGAVKNFHILELRKSLEIGLGKLEGIWKGKITALR
jgi:hypothetical protein